MPLVIIPSIDLRGGKVVRLRQGDYNQQLSYQIDPIETAQRFASAGARWLHIVDLDGAQKGELVQTDQITQIIRAFGHHVQVGGGVRSDADVNRLLEAGASRVVVGTKALEDWHWFERLVSNAQFHRKIVLALDARDGIVATRAWTASSGKPATDVAQWVSDWPLAGILYTDVARDGMLQGANLEQTRRVAEAGKVPVIASGGVGALSHIRDLAALPLWGVVIGRSLHDGAIDLTEALAIDGACAERD